MKCTASFVVLASGSSLGLAMIHNVSGTTLDTRSTSPHPIVEKRDAFTCYGSTSSSISDCQRIVDSIRTDKQQDFALYSDVCAIWKEGTCKVRFCAQPYVTRPVNRSAAWLATYIATPLLDGCISKGNMGVIADHPNINSHLGTYRLWVS